MKNKNILFISVDGIQNYLKSLFLPTLSRAQDENIKIRVLEFCPNDYVLRQDIITASEEYKVPVHFGTYFNQPPVVGSFFFISYGAIRTMYVVKKTKTDVLMPRSLLAGAMALLVKMFFRKLEIIYESDGLMSDERVDFGSWQRTGLLYRFFQGIEKKLVRDSIKVITRTEKAKAILSKRSPNIDSNKIIVIPNGKNSEVFKPVSEEKRKMIRDIYDIKENELLLIYVGSIGPQYRPDIMLKIFSELIRKKMKVKFLILTPNKEAINKAITKASIKSNGIIIDQIDPDKIAEYIGTADIGLTLRISAYSQQAVCPLKTIEYLMCGIPVIANSGIGDLDNLFSQNEVGYIIDDLDNLNLDAIFQYIENINKMPSEVSKKSKLCSRNVGLEYFDLNQVANLYRSILVDKK